MRKKILIGGIPYRIKRLRYKQKRVANINPARCTVGLTPGRPQRAYLSDLLHEVIHEADKHLSERRVRAIETYVFLFLAQNGLVRWKRLERLIGNALHR